MCEWQLSHWGVWRAPRGGAEWKVRHIGTKVIAYNPRRRCGRRRVGVSDLAPVSSWGDEDTIEQGPGVRIVRGEDEEVCLFNRKWAG